jgi:tetratricopeptide (TPR) repeat protein
MASSIIGECCHAQGRLGDALGYLHRALELQRETGNRRAEVDTLRRLALVRAEAGCDAEAFDLARGALTLADEIGDRRGQADTRNAVAACHRRLGHEREAAELHRQALRLARRTSMRYPEAVALIGLAASGPAAGDAETVFAHEALALTRKIGYRCLEGQALTTLAGIHLARDQPEQAIEHSRHALAIDRETGQRLHQAQTLLLLGLARRLT